MNSKTDRVTDPSVIIITAAMITIKLVLVVVVVVVVWTNHGTNQCISHLPTATTILLHPQYQQ